MLRAGRAGWNKHIFKCSGVFPASRACFSALAGIRYRAIWKYPHKPRNPGMDFMTFPVPPDFHLLTPVHDLYFNTFYLAVVFKH